MAAKAIAQIALDRDSGLPEDVITNTMHFKAQAGADTYTSHKAALGTRLVTLYQSLGSKFAENMAGSGNVKLYNFDDNKPRVPTDIIPFSFSPGAGSLPAEVALCVSYRGGLVSGTPQARRRGRIFLGPLNSAMALDAVGDVRPHPLELTPILDAFEVFAESAGSGFQLCVYSETNHIGGMSADASFVPVQEFWIDNAFDTVRSRGSAPTTRTFRVTNVVP